MSSPKVEIWKGFHHYNHADIDLTFKRAPGECVNQVKHPPEKRPSQTKRSESAPPLHSAPRDGPWLVHHAQDDTNYSSKGPKLYHRQRTEVSHDRVTTTLARASFGCHGFEEGPGSKRGPGVYTPTASPLLGERSKSVNAREFHARGIMDMDINIQRGGLGRRCEVTLDKEQHFSEEHECQVKRSIQTFSEKLPDIPDFVQEMMGLGIEHRRLERTLSKERLRWESAQSKVVVPREGDQRLNMKDGNSAAPLQAERTATITALEVAMAASRIAKSSVQSQHGSSVSTCPPSPADQEFPARSPSSSRRSSFSGCVSASFADQQLPGRSLSASRRSSFSSRSQHNSNETPQVHQQLPARSQTPLHPERSASPYSSGRSQHSLVSAQQLSAMSPSNRSRRSSFSARSQHNSVTAPQVDQQLPARSQTPLHPARSPPRCHVPPRCHGSPPRCLARSPPRCHGSGPARSPSASARSSRGSLSSRSQLSSFSTCTSGPPPPTSGNPPKIMRVLNVNFRRSIAARTKFAPRPQKPQQIDEFTSTFTSLVEDLTASRTTLNSAKDRCRTQEKTTRSVEADIGANAPRHSGLSHLSHLRGFSQNVADSEYSTECSTTNDGSWNSWNGLNRSMEIESGRPRSTSSGHAYVQTAADLACSDNVSDLITNCPFALVTVPPKGSRASTPIARSMDEVVAAQSKRESTPVARKVVERERTPVANEVEGARCVTVDAASPQAAFEEEAELWKGLQPGVPRGGSKGFWRRFRFGNL